MSMAWPNKKPAPADYKIPLIHPKTGLACPIPERGWRNPPSTMTKLLAEGKILFGPDHTTQPTRKYLLKDHLREALPSLLYHGSSDDDLFASLEIPFDNPKPVAVAMKMIDAFTRANDIVLDFFAGSGTVGHAVMELNATDGGNRRWIQVQLPEPTPLDSVARNEGFETISDIARKRIRRAANHVCDKHSDSLSRREGPFDTGFRAYRLCDTNFAKWHLTADAPVNEVEQHVLDIQDSARNSATQDALLSELLLKQGMSLTECIKPIEVGELTCYAVLNADSEVEPEDQYVLIAYVDEYTKPTLEQLRAIVELQSARLVILEDSFQGDDQLKTNLKQMCVTNDIELKTA